MSDPDIIVTVEPPLPDVVVTVDAPPVIDVVVSDIGLVGPPGAEGPPGPAGGSDESLAEILADPSSLSHLVVVDIVDDETEVPVDLVVLFNNSIV